MFVGIEVLDRLVTPWAGSITPWAGPLSSFDDGNLPDVVVYGSAVDVTWPLGRENDDVTPSLHICPAVVWSSMLARRSE